jgi:hypothetical protein
MKIVSSNPELGVLDHTEQVHGGWHCRYVVDIDQYPASATTGRVI